MARKSDDDLNTEEEGDAMSHERTIALYTIGMILLVVVAAGIIAWVA